MQIKLMPFTYVSYYMFNSLLVHSRSLKKNKITTPNLANFIDHIYMYSYTPTHMLMRFGQALCSSIS